MKIGDEVTLDYSFLDTLSNEEYKDISLRIKKEFLLMLFNNSNAVILEDYNEVYKIKTQRGNLELFVNKKLLKLKENNNG